MTEPKPIIIAKDVHSGQIKAASRDSAAPGGDAAGQRSASEAGRLWNSRPLRRRL